MIYIYKNWLEKEISWYSNKIPVTLTNFPWHKPIPSIYTYFLCEEQSSCERCKLPVTVTKFWLKKRNNADNFEIRDHAVSGEILAKKSWWHATRNFIPPWRWPWSSTPPCSGSDSTSSSVVRRTSNATFKILIVLYGTFNDNIVRDDEQ